MKIKTQDLAGAALDWAVAQANHHDEWSDDGLKPLRWYDISDNEAERRSYEPSDDWAHGGPILEAENIGLEAPTMERGWVAQIGMNYEHEASSALVAAMRCFVASKLGDEVDVPDELAGGAS